MGGPVHTSTLEYHDLYDVLARAFTHSGKSRSRGVCVCRTIQASSNASLPQRLTGRETRTPKARQGSYVFSFCRTFDFCGVTARSLSFLRQRTRFVQIESAHLSCRAFGVHVIALLSTSKLWKWSFAIFFYRPAMCSSVTYHDNDAHFAQR